jgi:hypothetical protein
MKAVLEFQYPEDERNLLYALKGAEMYKALGGVRALIKGSLDEPSTPMTALLLIEKIVEDVLEEVEKC